MNELINLIHQEIERKLRGVTIEIDGLVTSYDPVKHMAKVALQPEGQETGWLQIETPHMGNGFGIAIGLTPGDGKTTGDQVKVRFSYGDLESGKVSGRSHSDADTPPVAQAGEIVVQHKTGNTFKMDQAGNFIALHSTGAQTTTNADGTVVHMAAPGKFVYIGKETLTPGQAPTDSKYAFVDTTGGPSIVLKAQVTG